MVKSLLARPDITLTIDRNGLIRTAVASATLQDENLDTWRGRPWTETIEAPADIVAGPSADAEKWPLSFQVQQRLPSGRQLPIEFTAVSLGGGRFTAIGKNLQAMSDLQGRLLAEQTAREQDHWKIREIETRYRLLFDSSTEAVLLVRLGSLKIAEANFAANRMLGLEPGVEMLPRLQPRDRKPLEAMLEQVRDQGRAPGMLVHFGSESASWTLRASLMTTELGSYYFFQIAPVGAAVMRELQDSTWNAGAIIDRLPDGFVVVDRHGQIERANHAFLDLIQVGDEAVVARQNLKRWLSEPGADSHILLDLIRKHGSVRGLSTTISGELGASAKVEISAVGNRDDSSDRFGVILRYVTAREAPFQSNDNKLDVAKFVETLNDDAPLDRLVQFATALIERRAIKVALSNSDGNRTMAAKRLGLSRQSLHAKLNKYGKDDTL
jgi:transcriptional regulator PpsR